LFASTIRIAPSGFLVQNGKSQQKVALIHFAKEKQMATSFYQASL